MLDRLRREKLAVPAAMAFVVLGLMLVGIGLGLPHIATLQAQYGRNTIDFVQGLCFGIAFAVEIVGFASLIPALAAKRQKGPNGSR